MNLYIVKMDVIGRVFARYVNGISESDAMTKARLMYGVGAVALECELVEKVG